MVERVYSWRGQVARTDLPATTKHLLLVLACHADEFGNVLGSPTIETLAHDTGLSRRSIFQHLKKVERLGWVERRKQGLKGSRGVSTEYRLRWPETT